MKKIAFLLIFLLNTALLNSQSITVYDLDTTDYPVIRAKFFVFDNDNKIITDFDTEDFEVFENSSEREIISVSCPPAKPPTALSSVLTMDVSGSMQGYMLEKEKAAAKSWINGLPLGKSECAITSFDTKNNIIQDYTKDRKRLLDKINLLGAGGGTDYEVGFIRPMAGGLLLAKTGTYKRVLVFLTDGRPNYTPDVSKIIDTALANDVVIYAVTLDMRCPQCLKDICIQTGGKWFENVTTVNEARDIYVKIMQMTQDLRDPCEIEWITKNRCTSGLTNVDITYKPEKVSATGSYYLTYDWTERLEFDPEYVFFENYPIGITHDTIISVTAINADCNVSDIICTNPAFTIKPKIFSLTSGDSIQLEISYTPADSNYDIAEFDFINDNCEQKMYAGGGYIGIPPDKPTLKITHPDGKEVFVVGADTIITWEGISEKDSVKLEYSFNNGLSWNYIVTNVGGLTYNWNKIPKPESNQCLARVKQLAKTDNPYNRPEIFTQNIFGGSQVDISYDMKSTIDGGYIVVGESLSDDGNVVGNKGENDCWILKLDRNYNIQWQKTYGGSSYDAAYTVVQTNDGGYLIGARTESNDGDISVSIGDEDFWLIKLGPLGKIEWERTYGGTLFDRVISVQQTTDGGYVLAGETHSIDGNIGSNHGSSDGWVVKLAKDGSLEWEKTFGGSQYDWLRKIIQLDDGKYVIGGSMQSSDGNIGNNYGNTDFWVAMLDSDGNYIWEKNYGGSMNDIFTNMIELQSGDFIVIGGSTSSDGDFINNKGDFDYSILKINNSGNILWSKSYGGSKKEIARTVMETPDNCYIIAGYTASVDYDISSYYGNNDCWLIKLDSLGNLLWESSYGGSGSESSASLVLINEERFLMAAHSESVDGDVVKNNGYEDFWIVELSTEKEVLQQDDSDTLFSIVLPEISSIDIDMGKVLVGTTKDSVITGFITNTGTWECRIDSIYFQGIDNDAFSLVSGIPQYTVTGGDSHNAEFGFRPLKEGLHQAEIVIITQADTLIQNIQGVGIEPKLSVMCDIIDFGQVYLKEHKDTIKAIIENTGTASIEITKTEITGPDIGQFEIIGGGGSFTLNPGDERELTLRFKPEYLGKTSTNLNFYHKEAGSPALTQLYGEGIKKDADCDSSGFEYQNFVGVDDIILSGSTGRVDDFIRLTYANTSQAGAIWHEKPVPVGNGFITEFRFRLSSGNNENTDDGSSPGADGLAFVIQNNEGADLGLYGGGIGYHGIKNGLAVEFDLFMNNSKQIIDFKDPNGNHTAIQKTYGDKLSALHNSNNTIEINADIPELKSDGSIYYAKIEYNIEPNVMAVYLDETGVLDDPVIVAGGIELDEIVDLEEGLKAFVGITSATGNAYQIHDLLDWYFCPFPVDITAVESSVTEADIQFNIYPNPVSESASIEFNNPEYQFITLTITDIFGREIINIFSGYKSPGNISFNWNKKDIGDGIYFCRLSINNKNYVKSIIVSK